MSNTNSSNSAAVPEAKSALNRFKYEVANELGVPLTDGYNGNLTSKQNGSVGGYMVKKMIEAAGYDRKPYADLHWWRESDGHGIQSVPDHPAFS